MRITFELHTDDLNDEGLAALIALIQGATDQSIYVGEAPPGETSAMETATKLANASMEDDEPPARIFGQAEEGKSRRTKAQIAEDKDIEERWAALWPSKNVPVDKPAATLLEHIEKIEAEQEESPDPKEEEDDFDLGEDEPAEEGRTVTIEELRGLVARYSKAHGKAKTKVIMAPYSGLKDIPEDQLLDYAEKIEAEL